MKFLSIIVVAIAILTITFLWTGSRQQRQIDLLEQQQVDLQLEDSLLRGEVQRLDGDVERIEESVGSLRTDLQGIQTGVAELDERLNTRTDQLDEQVQDIARSSEDLGQSLTTQLENLKNSQTVELQRLQEALGNSSEDKQALLQKIQQLEDQLAVTHRSHLELVRRQQQTALRIDDLMSIQLQMQEALLRLEQQRRDPPDPRR